MSSLSRQSSVSSTSEVRKEPSGEVRLVLLGKTTAGKTSVANSILGRRAFKSKAGGGSSSVNPQRGYRACGEFRGRHITLVDTPATVDARRTSMAEVQRELRRCVTLLFPGVHAFLLVLQIGRFTQEEREAVRLIQQALGPRAFEYAVVVFTPGDGPGTSARDCPVQRCEGLRELVAKCGGRYCTFNNNNIISKTNNRDQVAELLNLVVGMSEANGGRLYTLKTLQELCDGEAAEEKKLPAQAPYQDRRRLQKVKEDLQKGEKERKEAMTEWYQRELEKIRQQSAREMEDLERACQAERETERRLCREREEAVRRERTEDNDKMEKERQIRDAARVAVAEIRKEEEAKRQALQERLEGALKTLDEQRDVEESMRREVGNIIQRHRVENENKERQWQVQQLEREQAIIQREEARREALQNELDQLTRRVEEKSSKEEKIARQRQELVRSESEKLKREMERALQNQKEERKKREILQQQLELVTAKAEALQPQLRAVSQKLAEHKAREAALRRELEESRAQSVERGMCQTCALREKRYSAAGCSEYFDEVTLNWPAAEYGSAALDKPISGYTREMGLLVMNAALESMGNPCCIQ